MINPVIFSFTIFGLTLTLRWYGVLVMLGALAAGWVTEKEVSRRGEKGSHVWDAMVWVLPIGILGARLWYVVNATIGGNNYYLTNPIQILNIPQGGLHIFGGFLFGGITLYLYLRKNHFDPWLFLDSVAPAALIGQAVARPANFINQELYGPPTTLPWGIPIDAAHRLPMYSNLGLYPLTTRFHPDFAYEMIWNFLAAALILWLVRRRSDIMKPGAAVASWLVLAGAGRAMLEFLRPDQPRIPGTIISYSAIVAALMAVAGGILLLVRFGKIKLGSLALPDSYQIAPEQTAPAEPVDEEEEKEEPVQRRPATSFRARRKAQVKAKAQWPFRDEQK